MFHFAILYIFRRCFSVWLLLCSSAILCAPSNNVVSADDVYLGKFSKGELTGWEIKEFDGLTNYQLVSLGANTGTVLQASSNNSASGLFKTQRIDLQKTPYLHWSWTTQSFYQGIDERQKLGDDYVARLYIVLDGGMFVWKTRAINYVWSSTAPKLTHWANPYTDNAIMFAVESGSEKLGKWVHYTRQVSDDIKTLLGKEVRYIDAIAIMTDSDNTEQQATTYYGDVYFSAQP